MAGWHAEDIVVDYFESDDWVALEEGETEPELEPPSPSPTSPSLFA